MLQTNIEFQFSLLTILLFTVKLGGDERVGVRFDQQGEWADDKIQRTYNYICEGSSIVETAESVTVNGIMYICIYKITKKCI